MDFINLKASCKLFLLLIKGKNLYVALYKQEIKERKIKIVPCPQIVKKDLLGKTKDLTQNYTCKRFRFR